MRTALVLALLALPALAAAGTLDDPECNFYPSLYDRQNCQRWGDPPPRSAIEEERRHPHVTVVVPPAVDPGLEYEMRAFLDDERRERDERDWRRRRDW